MYASGLDEVTDFFSYGRITDIKFAHYVQIKNGVLIVCLDVIINGACVDVAKCTISHFKITPSKSRLRSFLYHFSATFSRKVKKIGCFWRAVAVFFCGVELDFSERFLKMLKSRYTKIKSETFALFSGAFSVSACRSFGRVGSVHEFFCFACRSSVRVVVFQVSPNGRGQKWAAVGGFLCNFFCRVVRF